MSDTGLTIDEAMADGALDFAEPAISPAREVVPFEAAERPDTGPVASDWLTPEQAVDLLDDHGGAGSANDDRAVAVIDDTPLTVPELVDGYIAGRNLSGSLHDLHHRYDQVLAAATDVAAGADALAEVLSRFVTPRPDAWLASANPAAFVRQEAQHDADIRTLTTIVEHAHLAKRQATAVNVERHQRVLQHEKQKLIEHFPSCAEFEGSERFFDTMRAVAYECGFSEDELRQVVDHRMFRLAHMASKSLNRPTQRRKPRSQRPTRPVTDAVDRLIESGSMADAMQVDFA